MDKPSTNVFFFRTWSERKELEIEEERRVLARAVATPVQGILQCAQGSEFLDYSFTPGDEGKWSV